MEKLSGISIFVDVVDAGGFSAAANRLNLTRSAVGKTIARLEQRLGVRLFHRTTRAQSLTEQGQFFYDRCLKALEEISIGEALLESGKREVRGKLRISMPVIFGRQCIAPVLISLLDDHPELELDLSFNDRIVDLVDDGFDLVIRNGPLKDDPDLIARTIAHQRMTVCAAPSYIQRYGALEKVEDIAAHQGIIYGKADRHRTWIFPTDNDPWRQILPRSRLRLDDLATIRDVALQGAGLAWLPCWMVRDDVASGALVRLLTDVTPVVFNAHAVWPRSPVMLPKVRLAIDTLAQKLPRLME